ncbi:MAG: mechanosensitive ion channel family protein [Bacteroidales bacterium]|jgi:small-conductance mechanosensitive channel|nr:mechanosensitive ion channel family protein [Bacteroidales bacterium]
MEKIRMFLTEKFITPDVLWEAALVGGKILLLYFVLMALVWVERRIFKRTIRKRREEAQDQTNLIFIGNIVVYTTFAIGFLLMAYQIPGLQNAASAALAGAGILAAAIGFGSQQAISNIVSGIFMVIFKPFRIGDYIDLGGDKAGTVTDISLRHTTIRNTENRMIIVPNAVLNNQMIVNSSILHAHTCAFVHVGVGYGADLNRAIALIRDEAEKHPLTIDRRTPEEKENSAPQVVVRVIEWADSSVNLRAWVWAKDHGDAFVLKCDLLKSIKERFDTEGVEIPFPYRNVIIRQEPPEEPPQAET